MGSGKITISEVAREAGVSIATVSRVMQGRPSVAPELAQRVQEVARRLGYRPSPMARGLATGSTGMVGILVPQLSNPYFHELIKAIGLGAGQDGYRMLVLESDERVADEPDLAASLYAHADGVILCSPRMSDESLAALAVGRPHMLCVNRIPPGRGAVRGGLRQLLAPCSRSAGCSPMLGHRRVVYLAGVPALLGERRALAGGAGRPSLGLEPIRVQSGAHHRRRATPSSTPPWPSGPPP